MHAVLCSDLRSHLPPAHPELSSLLSAKFVSWYYYMMAEHLLNLKKIKLREVD